MIRPYRIRDLKKSTIYLEDADIVKKQLHRLTGRATFPNILLRSKSIGGFADIHALYESGQLRKMLEDEGITVRGG